MMRGFTFSVLLFLWLPLLLVLQKGASLEGFHLLFQNVEIGTSFLNSLVLALASGFLTTLFGLCTAFALLRFPRFLQRFSLIALLLPMVLPEIAFGLAYLILFQALGLSFGWSTILLAHVGFLFCYAVLILKNSVAEIDPSFVEAARDLGAPTWQVFRHGLLPQLLPGILAAFAMSCSLSLDDFLISFFVKGIDQMTLPIKIFSMMRLKLGAEIYSLSLVLFVISVVSVVISQAWFKKSKF